MQRELTVKDCNMAGSSDLTVVAPIIEGFVPALDAVTYKTRVKRVLRTLHSGRKTAHEFDLARMMSDAVERVGRIHSVRITIIEPQNVVLLAVTFDGAWESYVRVIWQKVARLLDLIFCNTEKYVNGWEGSFDEWGAWLRMRRVETSFLYATPGLTVGDVDYLRMQERLQRHRAGAELEANRITVPAAEEIAWQWSVDATHPSHLGLGQALDTTLEAQPAVFRQGLRSLAGLYRLADVYPPGLHDGDVLRHAAIELLPDFVRLLGSAFYDSVRDRVHRRFGEALDWLSTPESPPASRLPPALPDAPALPPLEELQGGVVNGYPSGTQGALLLVAFKSPAALAALLQSWSPTSAQEQASLKPGALVINIALSLEALRLAGLNDDQVAALPAEFAQGMERRAGVLGDLRANHPRRWRLPVRNWQLGINAPDVGEDAAVERVAMSAVHAVLQVRLVDEAKPLSQVDARRRIHVALQGLVQKHADIEPLSLQWMERLVGDDPTTTVEHFGFLDGRSQPKLVKAEGGRFFRNQVHLGEVLIGHPNAADPAPKPVDGALLQELLHNGSFLVIRKLRQDLAQLETVLAKGAADTGLDRDRLLGKMMGRWPEGHAQAGKPLVPLPTGAIDDNDFLYRSDPGGRQCPVHAHIRRANPREVVPLALQSQMASGARPPRLVRRGMSYGPKHDRNQANPALLANSLQQERGLVFMAYNASIGEQFEVVQRWLAGGNSTGGFSGQTDPFLGLPEPGLVRHYRFEDELGAATVRLALDGDTDMLAEPQPLVRLEWGGYFLAPSLPALKRLGDLAAAAALAGAPRYGWSAARGEGWIAKLRGLEQTQGAIAAREGWKSLLEDPGAAVELWTADIWAAVRANHGGLLRTPYGVLVGSRELVEQLLFNASANLTSTEYLPRMRRSFGEIYLGLDDGPRYAAESPVCNAAIMARDLAATRARAKRVVDDWIQTQVNETRHYAQSDEALRRLGGAAPRAQVHWELMIEIRELVDELLAVFCEEWFGLDDKTKDLQRSGQRWTWQGGDPPCYPGHFMAPSRYIFQAQPGPRVKEVGAEHGQAMLAAMQRFLAAKGYNLPLAPVSHAVLTQGPGVADRALAARSIIGALMGMVPTVDANLRRVCNLWLNEGTLWLLRAQQGALAEAQLDAAFVRAMLSRAAPDTLWRTVNKAHVIGADPRHQVAVVPGDTVVAGLNSATQQNLEQGVADVSPAFGGKRPVAPHPVHACPGYGPAMAMMLGFVEALVRSSLPLRAGPGPLTLMLDGREPFVEPLGSKALPEARVITAPLRASALRQWKPAAPLPAAALRKPLAAFGDSWLNWLPIYPELIGALPAVGYEVVLLESDNGRTLADMAAIVPQFASLLADDTVQKPDFKALLVGGGGNDIVQPLANPGASWLFKMLVPNAPTAAKALKKDVVTDFIDRVLFGHYQAILRELRAATAVPILVHGYDYPVPDGRDAKIFGVGPGPWLKPVFDARGLGDLAINREVMRVLIKRLNDMVTRVVKGFPNVHQVKFTGKLATQPPANWATMWDNELHPKKVGYDRLAAVLAAQLKGLGI